MTYHKRPMQVRKCAHCRTKFESNHQSRLYCSNSCNTQAWRARHGITTATGNTRRAQTTEGELPFTAHTVGVVAAGSAVGTLAVQAGTYLAQQVWQGGSDAELLRADMQAKFAGLRADLGLPPEHAPASFVPAAVRAATGPVRQLGPKGGALDPFVEVTYRGIALYYCAAKDVLLWSPGPNAYQRVSNRPMLERLVAVPPKGQPTTHTLPVAAAGQEPLPALNLGWSAVSRADVQAAEAAEAWRMAAFDQILREGLLSTEPGPG